MLVGTAEFGGLEYLVAYNIGKGNTSVDTFTVFSHLSENDRMNNTTDDEYLYSLETSKGFKLNDYMIGSKKVNILEKVRYEVGNMYVLNQIFDELVVARLQHIYTKDEILEESTTMTPNGVIRNKRTLTKKFSYNESSEGGVITLLEYSSPVMTLKLKKAHSFTQRRIRADYNSNQIKIVDKKELAASIKTFGMADVRNVYDLSWYENPDNVDEKYKDYDCIETNSELITDVIFDIVRYLNDCVNNKEEGIIAIDTETTGLMIANLENGNPNRDEMVSIPISWKEDQAKVIFTDMVFFENVDTKFVMLDFMKPLTSVKWEWEDSITDLWDDRFKEYPNCPPREMFKIDRHSYRIIGHNVIFDGKVFFQYGVKPFWDDDTLLMSFNLNPEASKKPIGQLVEKVSYDRFGEKNKSTVLEYIAPGNGLKNITRRLFNHETLELSTILGRGHEGNYNIIRDKEVAVLYGCADADYTRKVYFVLKRLYKENCPNILEKYREQDMPMIYKLYEAEYNGLLMDEEKVKLMAEQTRKDLDIIHHFLMKFAGEAVSLKSQQTVLRFKKRMKAITDEEYRIELEKIKPEPNSIYEFDMKSSHYAKLMYDKLGYPMIEEARPEGPKGQPKVGKEIRKVLLTYKIKSKILSNDVIGSDGKTVLVSKDKFNSYRYPVAYVIDEYATLRKEYDSYFKPILENNVESRIFNSFSLARIATRRIMNASQTMKSSLKEICLPFDGGKDYYMGDMDMAQVEYRIMVSDAGQSNMIERLKDPEKDFHRESASALSDTPAHLVTNKFRKQMKSVNFGIPYGLGERSLCHRMFGDINEENIYKTREILNKFSKANPMVMAKLQWYKEKCLRPSRFTDEFKKFTGFVEYLPLYMNLDKEGKDTGTVVPVKFTKKEMEEFKGIIPLVCKYGRFTGEFKEELKDVGMATSPLGFYRLFNLTDMENKHRAAYQRAAGNLPIQGYAAELFRICLIRFMKRCIKEGIDDKIKWHMLIHDELLYSVHKSIHPSIINKLIREECMISFEGHTNYFWGNGYGHSWGEAKSDSSEQPVRYVDYTIERLKSGEFDDCNWSDSYPEWIKKDMENWECFIRIPEEIESIQPNLKDTRSLDLKLILDTITNYEVRGYINGYEPSYYEGKDLTSTEHFIYALIGWYHKYTKGSGSVIINDKDISTSRFKQDSVNNSAEIKSSSSFEDSNIDIDEVLDLDDELDSFFSSISDNVDTDDLDIDLDDFDEMNVADSDELLKYIEMLENVTAKKEKEFSDYDLYLEDVEDRDLSLQQQLKIAKVKCNNLSYNRGLMVVNVDSPEQMETIEDYIKDFKDDKGNKLQYRILTKTYSKLMGHSCSYKTITRDSVSKDLLPNELDELVDNVKSDKQYIANGYGDNIKVIANKVTITKDLDFSNCSRLASALSKKMIKDNMDRTNSYQLFNNINQLLLEVDCRLNPVMIDKAINKLLKEVI